jgi:hypothetical protein
VLLDHVSVSNLIVPLVYASLFVWVGHSIFKRREFP